MDFSLPPFGIRDLDRENPYTILQVQERQYDLAVKSHPEASLTYIDEDDGEKVTVGSSFELKQRLAEPATLNAPLVHCYNSNKQGFENRLIHLFDIQRTNQSLATWKEHRANYDKSQTQHAKSRGEKEDNDSISSIDINSAHEHDEDTKGGMLHVQETRMPTEQQTSNTDLAIAISDALPDLVEHLASLLQSTSETLRRAAEKTRESKTSPIEDVLIGVESIVAEISSFGMSLLGKLGDNDKEDVPEREARETQINSEGDSPMDADAVNQDQCSANDLHVSVSSLSSDTSSQGQGQVQGDGADWYFELAPFICSFCGLPCHKKPESGIACHSCAALDRSGSWSPGPTQHLSATADHNDSFSPSSANVVRDGAILDQDTEDAEFSRRYPPLMSLRRANTIAGLHDRFSAPRSLVSNHKGIERHDSWARRYPHRPTPHILDAETQRRRDFARNCYPGQAYTPGPGVKEALLPSLRKATSLNLRSTGSGFHGHVSVSDYPSACSSVSIEAANDISESTASISESSIENEELLRIAVSHPPTDLLDSPSALYKNPLPGAWPEQLERRQSADIPAEESSGAFFNRMMRDNPARGQSHVLQENDRRDRHDTWLKQISDTNPFRGLNRSHTVSGTTNPASRLNRPFDPLYPMLPTPGTTATQARPDGHTRADFSPSGTSQPQVKFADRLQSIQRSFSPVWEEHSTQIRSLPGNQLERSATLDRNGESSSMYSPPPRHMRSVPNFTTSIRTTVDTSASSQKTAPAPETFRLSTTVTKPLSTFGAMLNESSLKHMQPLPPPKSVQVQSTYFPTVRSARAPSVTHVQPQVNRPARPSRPARPARCSSPARNDETQKCLTSLLAMGYGLDDDTLRARLHVYAEAAHGDVMEAVDMIEEDKSASADAALESRLGQLM